MSEDELIARAHAKPYGEPMTKEEGLAVRRWRAVLMRLIDDAFEHARLVQREKATGQRMLW